MNVFGMRRGRGRDGGWMYEKSVISYMLEVHVGVGDVGVGGSGIVGWILFWPWLNMKHEAHEDRAQCWHL